MTIAITVMISIVKPRNARKPAQRNVQVSGFCLPFVFRRLLEPGFVFEFVFAALAMSQIYGSRPFQESTDTCSGGQGNHLRLSAVANRACRLADFRINGFKVGEQGFQFDLCSTVAGFQRMSGEIAFRRDAV